jgi:hypothetical protein
MGVIFIECSPSFLPAEVPKDGKINVATIGFGTPSPDAIKTISLGQYLGQPGTRWNWGELSNLDGSVSKCAITNLMPNPLIRVSIPLAILITKAIPRNDGVSLTSGNDLASGNVDIVIPIIDSGMDHLFIPYLQNMTKFFVQAEILDQAHYERDDHTSDATPISLARSRPMILSPPLVFWKSINSPATSPPTPAPPR